MMIYFTLEMTERCIWPQYARASLTALTVLSGAYRQSLYENTPYSFGASMANETLLILWAFTVSKTTMTTP